MQPRVHIALAGVLLWVTQHTAAAKQIRLLEGRLLLDSPAELSPSSSSPTHSDRYSILADLASRDHSFSVRVTYGKHTLESSHLADFLHEKVTSYDKLETKEPHFRWIEHRIIQRDGRQWAVISFSHDNTSGAHMYTRCLSCFVEGRLLEIWVLTRRAADATQKAHVDRLIDSVRLAS
jgi:hypothetical protein